MACLRLRHVDATLTPQKKTKPTKKKSKRGLGPACVRRPKRSERKKRKKMGTAMTNLVGQSRAVVESWRLVDAYLDIDIQRRTSQRQCNRDAERARPFPVMQNPSAQITDLPPAMLARTRRRIVIRVDLVFAAHVR